MRSRLIRGDVIAFFLAIALIGLFSSIVLFSVVDNLQHSQVTPAGNAIVLENAHQGTTSWQIPAGEQATTQIQAYVDATSVQPGQTLTFYVSTLKENTQYEIDIYRLGWYGGKGGRLMFSTHQIGQAQGYYNQFNQQLVNCPTCLFDIPTGLIEADWHPSYHLQIPSFWMTGVYLAKFTDAGDAQTYVPFDVRGNPSATYVAVTPDTTYAAYNDWGGYSLYTTPSRSVSTNSELASLGHGVKVSFDRPYEEAAGSGQVLNLEADAIHWLEREGYDLSYISDVDVHEDPTQLLHHRAYISLGHDEYWTKEMRDGVEQARDHGIGLAFLGANAGYWQMRFEPDSTGSPNRTIVCYKVSTVLGTLAHDPLYGDDNTRVTAEWRDPLLARPENALVGIMFSNFTSQQRGFPWKVSSTAHSPLLAGTGLQPGKSYGCGLVGYEWDRIFNNGATPAGLQVIGTSTTLSESHTSDVSNTTYYIARSGAMVFATGSISWTAALDSYRFAVDKTCAGHDSVVPAMQQLMLKVMAALIIHYSPPK
jgi:hypothetical protein